MNFFGEKKTEFYDFFNEIIEFILNERNLLINNIEKKKKKFYFSEGKINFIDLLFFAEENFSQGRNTFFEIENFLQYFSLKKKGFYFKNFGEKIINIKIREFKFAEFCNEKIKENILCFIKEKRDNSQLNFQIFFRNLFELIFDIEIKGKINSENFLKDFIKEIEINSNEKNLNEFSKSFLNEFSQIADIEKNEKNYK